MSIKKKSKLNINSRGGMGGKSKSRPSRSSSFKTSDTAGTMIKVVIGLGIIALIISQWQTIGAVFGFGLILLVLGITVAVAVFKREAVLEFARKTTFIYWYRWLGAIVLIGAVWGLLGIMGTGGVVGNSIINSDTGFGGFLRVTGLFILALVLIIPAAGWAVTKWLFGGITRPFRVDKERPGAEANYQPVVNGNRPPLRQSMIGDRPVLERKPVAETAIPASTMVQPEEKPSVEKEAAAKSDKDAKEPRDLKQVSQDVWKKYGETATLLTADGWRLPPVEILDYTPEIEYGEADNQERARMIEEALGSYGVEAAVVQINAGPTVTQFGVEPGWDRRVKEVKEKDKDGNPVTKQVETGRTRVKVDRISSLSNDLALALAAPSIRIEAPIPGKSLVGIEVPNTMLGSVSMRSVIETTAFQKLKAKAPLAVALGKGAGGEAVVGDLAKMPHLLIAGATGSGKTVCLNALICCLLMNNTPNDVRFIMVDPKRVELTPYNSMPHLAAPVIVDVDKAIGALKWLAGEMDRRYRQMAEVTARNIDAYNKKPSIEKMPYLVLVIDELADLMMAGFDDVEHLLCRLAQMARAVGIHLVVATQRPSVDVITGLIKANFPTRISFAVTSQVDSRTILDSIGAEKLLGRGDMLYMPTDAAKPKRLQGCYVSDQETERMVYFWNGQHPEANSPMLKVEELATAQTPGILGGTQPRDSLFDTAMQLAQESGNISASFLQRKLHIGYPRAARLADEVKEALGQDTDDGGAEVPADDDTLLR
ncbi:MAG: DNA translocase FtsK [Dehalogenimonas sp.]